MFHPQCSHQVAHILQANKVHHRHRMGHRVLELMLARDHKALPRVLHKVCLGQEDHQVVLRLLGRHQHLHLHLHLLPEVILLHHHLVHLKRVTIPNTAQDQLVLLVRVSSYLIHYQLIFLSISFLISPIIYIK